MNSKFLPGYLENIFVNAPIGIFTTDLNRVITSSNYLTAKLHGFESVANLMGLSFPDFIEYSEQIKEKLHRVLKSEISKADIDYELEVRDTTKTIRLISTLLRDDNYMPIGLLSMCEDITKEKYLAEQVRKYTHNLENMVKEKTVELKDANAQLVQSEKLRVLGNLVVSVAHEMGNPLCSLEYLLADIGESVDDEKVRNTVELCRGEIERMGRLLFRLRELYRPSGVRKTLMNINQLLDDVLEINRIYLANNSIQVSKVFSSLLPAVHVFPDQIKQVFMNIIINAVDSMPEGGQLRVSTWLEDSNIVVEFADSGMGIEKENLDKIFKSFFSTKNNSNGLGLGLSVSSQIVNAHGGKLWVKSEPGRGSTFYISLHADKAAPDYVPPLSIVQ